MNATTETLAGLVDDYLRVRRALGYKLDGAQSVLGRFIAYLEARDADAVTVADAVGFATAPPARTARTQALRLSAIRCFTRWAHCQRPDIEVPPISPPFTTGSAVTSPTPTSRISPAARTSIPCATDSPWRTCGDGRPAARTWRSCSPTCLPTWATPTCAEPSTTFN